MPAYARHRQIESAKYQLIKEQIHIHSESKEVVRSSEQRNDDG